MSRNEPGPGKRDLLPSETREVLDSVRRVVQRLRQFSATAESLAPTPAQVLVLEALSDQTGLSVNELAERTCTDQSTVSVVAKRLVERGLLRRVRSREDGRRVELSLTRRGRDVLARVGGDLPQRRVAEAVLSLDPATRRRLVESLRSLVVAMEGGTPSSGAPARPRGRR